MQVDVKTPAMLLDDGGLSRVDKALELAPGLLRQRMTCCRFGDFAIAVYFAAVYAANDEVRPTAGPIVQFVGHGPR